MVTDDPDAAAALAGIADVVPDLPGDGINAALQHGAAAFGHTVGRHFAAVQADLPALRPAELAAALRAAARAEQAFVADAAGSGTTIYAATAAHVRAAVRPRVGGGASRGRPRNSRWTCRRSGVTSTRSTTCGPPCGSVSVRAPQPCCRRCRRSRRSPHDDQRGSRRDDDARARWRRSTPRPAPASVLLDDGLRLPFGAGRLRRSGLRSLRLGQRVWLEIDGSGDDQTITALTVVTLPLR